MLDCNRWFQIQIGDLDLEETEKQQSIPDEENVDMIGESSTVDDEEKNADSMQDNTETIYEGSDISVTLYKTMLMLFALRHKLTMHGLKALVNLICYTCPTPNKCYTTVYRLRKYFIDKLGGPTPQLTKTCKRCLKRVNQCAKRCSRNARCKRAGVFEYYIFDIKGQLKVLLKGILI